MRIAIAGATGLIGAKLADLAKEQGNEVVPLSRASGFDLTDESVHDKLVATLKDVDAVVDVTQGADFEEEAAVSFYRTVATILGRAATEAGVPRTVVLSIVGIERNPDYGYYVAKVAQEEAHREHSPGLVILRATQFHEFAGQMIDWFTTDGVAKVMDVEVQPVASGEVVALLLDMATGEVTQDVQLAGPAQDNLVELSTEYVTGLGLDVTVEPDEAPESMKDGGMLPQVSDGVIVRGPDWHTWFEQTYATK